MYKRLLSSIVTFSSHFLRYFPVAPNQFIWNRTSSYFLCLDRQCLPTCWFSINMQDRPQLETWMSFCQSSEDFHAPMFTLLLMTVCFLHGILSSYKCPCGLCRWAERFNVTLNQPMLCSIARWLLARSGQCCMERTLDKSTRILAGAINARAPD